MFRELLKRQVSEDVLSWLATYLKQHNPNRPVVAESME